MSEREPTTELTREKILEVRSMSQGGTIRAICDMALRTQAAEAELLTLARTYDPNCDEYHFEDQKLAMDYARRCVDSLQELACYFGSDPEGDLTSKPDDAMGRIDELETQVAELKSRVLSPADAERIRAALEASNTQDGCEIEEYQEALRILSLQATPAAGTGSQQVS